MSLEYWLPNKNNGIEKFETDINSVVIIGANGAGKSKLGAWIEKQNLKKVHRIGAQRSLNFKKNISLKSYSQAEDFVFYGTDIDVRKHDKQARWGYEKGDDTTKLINDFEDVLAALLAPRT